jgi:hypothetical protein
MMKSLLRLAACLSLVAVPAMPAFAEWQGTQWGMSPDEALSLLDGASAHSPAASEIVQYGGVGYQPLVKLPHQANGIAGKASLLFDAQDKLQFVVFAPDDLQACDDLTAALQREYGAAEESGFGATAIYNWVDDHNVIRLTSSADIGMCNLSYGAI